MWWKQAGVSLLSPPHTHHPSFTTHSCHSLFKESGLEGEVTETSGSDKSAPEIEMEMIKYERVVGCWWIWETWLFIFKFKDKSSVSQSGQNKHKRGHADKSKVTLIKSGQTITVWECVCVKWDIVQNRAGNADYNLKAATQETHCRRVLTLCWPGRSVSVFHPAVHWCWRTDRFNSNACMLQNMTRNW